MTVVVFQASVPNTWAAIQATLKVGWKSRDHLPAEPWVAGVTIVCECGQLKPIKAWACARCARLDGLAGKGQQHIERDVIAELRNSDGLTAVELGERMGAPHMLIQRAIRKFLLVGKISRRRSNTNRWILFLPDAR